MSTKRPTCWNIHTTRAILGNNVCGNFLLVHAVLGCDTTSLLFGTRKCMALTHILDNPYFRKQAQVFNQESVIKDNVILAEENVIVSLYNGKRGESINALRIQHFCDKVNASTTCVQPHTIPPTSAAMKYHSLCVYLFICKCRSGKDQLDSK